ncbi:sulfurtransferase complex subunit TusC [Paraglaciecola aquimarina]|uniref:Sulfurtransferase complex subunit TusC n=1 Tax=Paraglaciecola aquimarina TaxID=1235557 RepID=A0ABU3SYD6_9ALTE|nr:sulfurtransferase complex subunit TusC [Paraglaciecola aquimarina]MDU0354992.1 sulfurtransferase complex subunit TusC [Paraglaciecola aquimarina]
MNTDNQTSGLAIVNKTASYDSVKGQESVELALALSNFGQAVSLFFIEDGVWQLLRQQNPAQLNRKAYFKTFAALEFYDIDKIYVCHDSLLSRGISEAELCIPVTLVTDEQCQQLLSFHNQVVVF